MSKLKFLFILGALTVLTHAEENIPPENHNVTDNPITTSTSPITTTTKVPTTPTTTTPPETTTKATTTTPSPKTTTVSPKTTTVSPKTTTISPNTTTISPKTTSTPITTPLPPKPSPIPNPQTGTWNVPYESKNMSCIIAKMAIQIQVPYVTKENKTKTGFIDVPINANSSGICGVSSQEITLKWNNDSINFTFDNNNHTYALHSINITIVPDGNFSDAMSLNPINLIHEISEFNVTSRKSYKCNKEQTLNLTHLNSNETYGVILISHLQLQAFNTDNKFVEAVDCEPFDTPDIIPIAAGIALGILIAFVLIGYLVGRRRSQARGYLSMFTQTKREEDYIPMKNLSCFN